MPDHSPEPWGRNKWDRLVDAEDEKVFELDDCGSYDSCDVEIAVKPEDVARIIACVNFCALIPTPLLEKLVEAGIGAATFMQWARRAEWVEVCDIPEGHLCLACSHLHEHEVTDGGKPICPLDIALRIWKENWDVCDLILPDAVDVKLQEFEEA